MQSEALTTLTARYSLREDRIIVDGVIHTGDELQLAFTQRLERALVAELVRQVSARTDNPLMHDFAKDEAIRTKPHSDAVRVIFTEDDARAVHLDCAEAVLRNLIDIFHKSFAAAEWDANIFPAWAIGRTGEAPQSQVIS